MSSSSSSSSMNRLRKRCYCGDPVGRWTSWTPLNPGRRFIGCPNYQNGLKDCKYFRWVDPPLPSQWYADLLLVLHNNVNLENHRIFGEFGQEQPAGNFFGDVVEQPMTQQPIAQQAMEGGRWKSLLYVSVVSFVFLFVMLMDW
ncbi:unnamed protein product [Lactuca saligna]|uniref:GRF-type domain-containing protein n=1 Tax=Lactuca saligna TaxID=75948 RepID=A0AA36EKW9_LACSI|nr:unnamed protein product [Lactuca saligna]